jgi:phage tail-like protein
LRLIGFAGRSPRLFGLRASFARPSLLRHLPAFWRADSNAAASLDRFRSQFEGFTTDLSARIDALHHLFTACGCPPAELDWLAGFMAQALDPRLPTARQRALIGAAMRLHQERGTVRGLERLCTILTGSRSVVLEGFRLRGKVSMLLGSEADGTGTLPSVIGSLYRLGMNESAGATSGEEPYEKALRQAYQAMQLQREAIRKAGETPCPKADPEPYLDPDPRRAFYRRFAHRFTLVIFGEPENELRSIVEFAVERYKPAHTVHQICFARAGLRVGQSSYVGLGTQLGRGQAFLPARLGTDGLGRRTLGYPDPPSPRGIRSTSPHVFAGTENGTEVAEMTEEAVMAERIDPR